MHRWQCALLLCAACLVQGAGGSAFSWLLGGDAGAGGGGTAATPADDDGNASCDAPGLTAVYEDEVVAAGHIPAALNRTFTALKKWLKAGGGRVSRHLQLYETGALRGRGLRVAPSSDGGVRKGDTLAFIPWKMTIKGSAKAKGQSFGLTWHNLLQIMADDKARGQWQPYLASFPKSEELLNMPPESERAKQCPPEAKSQWGSAARALGEMKGYKPKDAWRAMQLAASRSFAVNGKAHMIPLWDLVNHNVTLRNVALHGADGGAAVVATRDIPPGGEVYAAYATRGDSNPTSLTKFYSRFGFVDLDAVRGYELTVRINVSDPVREGFGCGEYITVPLAADATAHAGGIPDWFTCFALAEHAAVLGEAPTAAALKRFKRDLKDPSKQHALISRADAALAAEMRTAADPDGGRSHEACAAAKAADPVAYARRDMLPLAVSAVRAARVFIDGASRASWPDTPTANTYKTLVDFVVDSGGYVTNKIFLEPTGGRGNILRTTKDHTIKKGDEMVFIPHTAVIQRDASLTSTTDRSMYEPYITAKKTRTEFHAPYFNNLPDEVFSPALLAPEESTCFSDLLSLDSSPMKCSAHHGRVIREIAEENDCDIATAEAAWAAVASRAFGDRYALVPIFDLGNHDTDAHYALEMREGGYYMTAIRDVPPDTEVNLYYNALPPDTFYRNYGFHSSDFKNINLRPLRRLVGTSDLIEDVCGGDAFALPPDGTVPHAMRICAHFTGLYMHETFQDEDAASAFLRASSSRRDAAMKRDPHIAWATLHERLHDYLADLDAAACDGVGLATTPHGREILKVRAALARVAAAALKHVNAKLKRVKHPVEPRPKRAAPAADSLAARLAALRRWIETSGGYVNVRLDAVEAPSGERRVHLRAESKLGIAKEETIAVIPKEIAPLTRTQRPDDAAIALAKTAMARKEDGLAHWLATIPGLPPGMTNDERVCYTKIFGSIASSGTAATAAAAHAATVQQAAHAQGLPEGLALRCLELALRMQSDVLGPLTDMPNRCPAHLKNAEIRRTNGDVHIMSTAFIAPGDEICWYTQSADVAGVRAAGFARTEDVEEIMESFGARPRKGDRLDCSAAVIGRDGAVSEGAVACALYAAGITDAKQRAREASRGRELVRDFAERVLAQLDGTDCLNRLPASRTVDNMRAVRALYLDAYRGVLRREGRGG